MSNAVSVPIVIHPASTNSWMPWLNSPAAMKIKAMPVHWKKVRRLRTRAPRYRPMPMTTAMMRPTSGADQRAECLGAGGGRLAHEEERRLDSLADHGGEGKECQPDHPTLDEGAVDARVRAHP